MAVDTIITTFLFDTLITTIIAIAIGMRNEGLKTISIMVLGWYAPHNRTASSPQLLRHRPMPRGTLNIEIRQHDVADTKNSRLCSYALRRVVNAADS